MAQQTRMLTHSVKKLSFLLGAFQAGENLEEIQRCSYTSKNTMQFVSQRTDFTLGNNS